jgi:hypothetical protein
VLPRSLSTTSRVAGGAIAAAHRCPDAPHLPPAAAYEHSAWLAVGREVPEPMTEGEVPDDEQSSQTTPRTSPWSYGFAPSEDKGSKRSF